MTSEKSDEVDAPVAVAHGNVNAPTALFAPVKSATEELPPIAIQASRGSVLQEPTIRQVAPLVVILTGAAFLNVSALISNRRQS